MGKKDILKVLSKSDEKRRSCSVYKPKFRKIPPFTPPRTPQNHPTVTIFNRVSLRWVKKIFWKFYQNRMKNEGAVLFTSRCHTHTYIHTYTHTYRHDHYNTPPTFLSQGVKIRDEPDSGFAGFFAGLSGRIRTPGPVEKKRPDFRTYPDFDDFFTSLF